MTKAMDALDSSSRKHKKKEKKRKRRREEETAASSSVWTRDDKTTTKKSKSKQSSSSSSSLTRTITTHNAVTKPTKIPFPHVYILAPMVGASELAFRLLCRQYGAQVCYTPMMAADQFAHNPSSQDFQTCAADRPLVCHFSANRPEDLRRAAVAAQPYCDAIDLNLGWYV